MFAKHACARTYDWTHLLTLTSWTLIRLKPLKPLNFDTIKSAALLSAAFTLRRTNTHVHTHTRTHTHMKALIHANINTHTNTHTHTTHIHTCIQKITMRLKILSNSHEYLNGNLDVHKAAQVSFSLSPPFLLSLSPHPRLPAPPLYLCPIPSPVSLSVLFFFSPSLSAYLVVCLSLPPFVPYLLGTVPLR